MTGMAAGTTTSSPIRFSSPDFRAHWPRLETGAKLLVLADACRAAALRAHAPEATVLTDAAALEGMEAQFDAAVIDGLLEHERWDRWLLQRVHRALRADAPIVVVVPPLVSLASAADGAFLAYISRQLLRRLVQWWRPGFELPGRARRRYHLPRLARKLESAGYGSIEAGPGWPGSAGPPHWLARRSIVTARKASSPPGGKRSAEQGAAVAGVRALEPAEWRDARVLVLAPHPDDELIGCGGTLCRLVSAGAKVSILQATDGGQLESLCDLPQARRKTVRLEEAERVAAALGAGLVLWREEDGRLRCSGETVAKLARLLDELRPTHVFTPFLGDRHGDHRTLSRILGAALGSAGVEPQVLQYEVWGLVPANLYCDVTREAQTLERLLLLYERAMRVENFVYFCESRNRARALELTGGAACVEAFLCTSAAQYRRLVEHKAS